MEAYLRKRSGQDVRFSISKPGFDSRWARRFRDLADDYGSKTAYWGSPRSRKQIRLYEKDAEEGIIRLEAVPRLEWLRRNGIYVPHHLSRLCHLELDQLVQFREFDKDLLAAKLDRIANGYRREAWDALVDLQSTQQTARMLRRDCGVDPNPLLRTSPELESLQLTLERMLRNLVWKSNRPF